MDNINISSQGYSMQVILLTQNPIINTPTRIGLDTISMINNLCYDDEANIHLFAWPMTSCGCLVQ